MAKIEPDKLYRATFDLFEIRVPGQAVIDICGEGTQESAEAGVVAWKQRIMEQADRDAFRNGPTPVNISGALRRYGVWTSEDLGDRAKNWLRLIWVSAWQIFESDEPDCSDPFINTPDEDAEYLRKLIEQIGTQEAIRLLAGPNYRPGRNK